MNNFPHSFDIIPGTLLFTVSDRMDAATTRRIAQIVDEINGPQGLGIREIIPSYGTVLVIYDETISTADRLASTLTDTWNRTQIADASSDHRSVSIDVVYGDTFGDDLANVSAFTGKTVEEVITLHASGEYTVGAVGFSPGFTYLIGLPPSLATPRKTSPRLRVPAGSVGIGGDQTGVYALRSAGGWNLIGRSPTVLFDPEADPPVRLRLGDRVRFRPVERSEWPEERATTVEPAGDGPVEVVSPGVQSTIQDLGRYGVARYGFATDGALDRANLIVANRLVGNRIDASCLEIAYLGPTLRFRRRMQFALSGADLGARLNNRPIPVGRVFETMPGDELEFVPGPSTVGARAYLAVRGGWDVPLVMGSASTNLVAGIGGWQGRALVAGDRLSVGQREFPEDDFAPGLQPTTPLGSTDPFRIQPGPQRDRFDDATWQTLLTSEFAVSDRADRVGVRLEGPSLMPVDGADILSEGIVTGSIQVTGEGQAIVMLPGHATIGGYTKIATIVAEDWDRLGQLSPGDTIRFTEQND